MSLFRPRRLIARHRPLVDGSLVQIEVNWYKGFAYFPRRTIGGKFAWLKKIYKRRVWRYTGLGDEPFVEYADEFDILSDKETPAVKWSAFPVGGFTKE